MFCFPSESEASHVIEGSCVDSLPRINIEETNEMILLLAVQMSNIYPSARVRGKISCNVQGNTRRGSMMKPSTCPLLRLHTALAGMTALQRGMLQYFIHHQSPVHSTVYWKLTSHVCIFHYHQNNHTETTSCLSTWVDTGFRSSSPFTRGGSYILLSG